MRRGPADRRRRGLGGDADRTTFRTLHTASLASPALREGLTSASAQRSIRHLRDLLGVPALALTDTATALAWDGGAGHHEVDAPRLALPAVDSGSTKVFDRRDLRCATPGCPLRHVIVSPLIVEERIVGTLQAYAQATSAGLVRATDEVAQWVSGQLELAELDASRTRLMEAEVKALRAQISPHFIYNSLGAIASFVRTDPDRARELLLEFADFTRYSFRRHGEFTTLAEELKSIERYLLLEQARFGDRLAVTLRIAPEVLPVAVPFLCLQPLVENAVRHGLAGTAEATAGVGTITIVARDLDTECEITVEDNGAGEDPEKVRRALAGNPVDLAEPADPAVEGDHVGLGNVDARLRTTFGDDYGLVVETARGAGTKVIVRVPKFAPGVHA
ncbi:sensor histidine kinase [Nocardioides limicola]|uniref:sensor histidine kinase n=1 Tax=Nocardioides limicola TaxID=2803368 RepID=UPI0027DBE6FE|nr:histidine kinase [Nocardioides sp. DJM-14]